MYFNLFTCFEAGNLYNSCIICVRFTMLKRGGVMMGRDREGKKLTESGRVTPDRDQALHYPGSTKMQSPAEARKLNDGKQST
jgi:hypothetical protein